MKIISVEESAHKSGGVVVVYDDGKGPIPFHIFEGMVSPRASQLRLAIKGLDVLPLKDVKSREKKLQKDMRKKQKSDAISSVNNDLKSLGAREITKFEEIPNAKAFIQFERARIFREDEGF